MKSYDQQIVKYMMIITNQGYKSAEAIIKTSHKYTINCPNLKDLEKI